MIKHSAVAVCLAHGLNRGRGELTPLCISDIETHMRHCCAYLIRQAEDTGIYAGKKVYF